MVIFSDLCASVPLREPARIPASIFLQERLPQSHAHSICTAHHRGLGLASSMVSAQLPTSAGPYKILQVEKVGGAGGFDYVQADADGRRLYIARGNRMTVFDLDSLKAVGEIPDTKSAHGAAVDTASHHGFVSSNPVVMFDTLTLATIKTIAGRRQPGRDLFRPGEPADFRAQPSRAKRRR